MQFYIFDFQELDLTIPAREIELGSMIGWSSIPTIAQSFTCAMEKGRSTKAVLSEHLSGDPDATDHGHQR